MLLKRKKPNDINQTFRHKENRKMNLLNYTIVRNIIKNPLKGLLKNFQYFQTNI